MATLGCACACVTCANRQLGTSPSALVTSSCGTTPLTPQPVCCWLPLCGRLRVVVLCVPPCSAIPGVGSPPPANTVMGYAVTPAVAVNAPPATTITAGLPFGTTLCGRPAAYPSYAPLPPDLVSTYGITAGNCTQLVFDFGFNGTYVAPASYHEASGRVLALGAAGAAQASVSFTYRWCAPLRKCGAPSSAEPFEVTGCSTKGLTFVLLDGTTYLSSDACTESIVVFNLQQYCAAPADSTPPTIPACLPRPLAPVDVGPLLTASTLC